MHISLTLLALTEQKTFVSENEFVHVPSGLRLLNKGSPDNKLELNFFHIQAGICVRNVC